MSILFFKGVNNKRTIRDLIGLKFAKDKTL
jgi:hypothetical protein